MLKLQAIGNLGYNAIIQSINNYKVINFSLANNETYKDDKGEKKERTVWIQCSYWRGQGSSISVAEYLTSGTKVFVEGVPFLNTYTDKNGEKQTALSLRVERIELLSVARNEHIKETLQEDGDNITKDDLPY